jgi:hypothetical protein
MTELLFYSLPLGFMLGLCCYFAWRAGRGEGAAAQKEREEAKEKDARAIEDRLRRDAAFARRVRQRFTR